MGSAEANAIAPSYIRERRITLTLDPDTPSPRVRQDVLINVDYSAADPEGLVLPLVLEVRGPTDKQTREYTLDQPDFIAWVPREGGTHMLMLREVAHNLWFGSLQVEVAGDLADE